MRSFPQASDQRVGGGEREGLLGKMFGGIMCEVRNVATGARKGALPQSALAFVF